MSGADYLALGDWNAACAWCGRKRKASTMRQLPPGVPGGGLRVCPDHWNPRQPQKQTTLSRCVHQILSQQLPGMQKLAARLQDMFLRCLTLQ